MVFQCQKCLGKLDVKKGMRITECPYCGTQQTISKKDTRTETPVPKMKNKSVEYFINHGIVDLKNKDWGSAQRHFDLALAEDAEEHRAYIGLLCLEFKMCYEEDLIKIGKPIMDSMNYRRACKFGGKGVEERLYSYVTGHDEYEYRQNLTKYNDLLSRLAHATSPDEFKALIKKFTALEGFADSAKKVEECRYRIKEYQYNEALSEMRQAKTSNDYAALVPRFREIEDFPEALRSAGECQRKADETRYQERLDQYNSLLQEMKNATTSKEYAKVAKGFQKLEQFKESKQKAEECLQYSQERESEENWNKICNSKPGDSVQFGDYQWIVIDIGKKDITLLCAELVSKMPYNDKVYELRSFRERTRIKLCGGDPIWDAEIVTWEESALRKWLNTEFYNRFSEDEKKVILKSHVDNQANPYHHTKGGYTTTDYIFLLSIQEFNDCKIDLKHKHMTKPWWLRSPGEYRNHASLIEYPSGLYPSLRSGEITTSPVNLENGVRPVLRLKIR